MTYLRSIVLAAVVCASAAIPTIAQPLTTAFTYQGQLQNAGSPATGTYDFKFALFDSAAGVTQIGSQLCADNIAVSGGQFTVQLDFGSQFDGQQRFLEVWVRPDTGLTCASNSGFTILAPRQNLTATPNAVFALNAANATSANTAAVATTATTATNATNLNGQPATFYTSATNLTAGTIPDARLSLLVPRTNAANAFTNNNSFSIPPGFTATTGTAPFVVTSTTKVANLNADVLDGLDSTAFSLATHTHDASAITTGLLADARLSANIPKLANINLFTNTQNFITPTATPVTISSPNTGGTWLNFSNTSAGGHGYYLIATGPGNSEGAGKLLIRDASAGAVRMTVDTDGSVGIGTTTPSYPLHVAGGTSGTLYAENTFSTGAAVVGNASGSNGYGVEGDSQSPTGYGVVGAGRAFSGANRGVYGYSNSDTGTGVYGQVTWTSGINYGGFFHSSSSAGFGLWAENTSSGNAISAQSNGNDAIVGQTNTSGKSSIFGFTSTVGANGGYFNSSAITGTGKGVVGQSNSSSGYGVYAFGNTGASGTKSFRIDHPLDPENKYLNHYCAEGPEPLNVYRGTIRLDSAGEAVVKLPPYFAAINKDPSYQLTPIGASMPMLRVDMEVSEDALARGAAAEPGQPVPACSFRIAGGAPSAKVSWEVKALRNDRWVQINGAPVEVEKLDREKGTYQHPELFHQPAERATNYDSTRSLPLPLDHATFIPGGL